MDRIPRDRLNGAACGSIDVMRPVVEEGIAMMGET